MNFINAVTSFERQHFNKSTVTLHPHGHHNALRRCPLTDDQIVRLSGAPTGAMISVTYEPDVRQEGDETIPPGIFFEVDCPTYFKLPSEIGLFEDGRQGAIGIYWKLLVLHDKPQTPPAFGARMLATIVREAMRIPGVTRITLLAAGGVNWPDYDYQNGRRWGGYVAWPTYGFDMAVQSSTAFFASFMKYFPRNIASCNTVSEVLAIVGGRDFWKVAGDGWYMDFDLSSLTSRSIATLNSFLERTGV